jgi:hypothetical protein
MVSAKLTKVSDTEISVAFMDGQKPVPEARLGASDIEKFIAQLAALREGLSPKVGEKPPNREARGPIDPRILLYNAALPGRIMVIRHPGIGWLSVIFSENEASKLGQALLVKNRLAIRPPSDRQN